MLNIPDNRILESFLDAHNLGSFVEEIALLVENPVAVLDATSTIIAHSDVSGVDDETWSSDVENGYYNDEIIAEIIAKDRETDLMIETGEAYVRSPKGNSAHHRIISNLWSNGHLFGTFVVLHISGDRARIQEAMPLISRLILKYVSAPAVEQRFGEYFQDYTNLILVNLLKGNIKEADLTFMRTVETQFGNSNYFQLLSVPITQTNQFALHTLRRNMESIFGNCKMVYYERRLQILRASVSMFQNDEFFHKRLNDLTGRFQTRVCFSDAYTNVMQTSFHYNRNVRTLKLAAMLGESRHVVFYENYLLLDAVLKAASDNAEVMDNFIVRKILLIREYDKAHNTMLFETLYEFMKSRESYSLAAKNLHIHRNTVLYRMNQIKTLFDVDLSSFDEFLRYVISCRIARYSDIIREAARQEPER
jgi:hypothetical protein